MAKIIDLNEAVGEDIVFQYGQPVVEYAIPGDINVATVFELFEMFQSVSKIEGDDPDDLTASVKRQFDALTGKLLELFQVRQPDLDRYPFGIAATGVILRNILGALGVNVVEDPPKPATPRRRSATRTKTSSARKRR